MNGDGPNSTPVSKKGVRDVQNKIYWADNDTKLFTVYKNGTLLWQFNFGNYDVTNLSIWHI